MSLLTLLSRNISGLLEPKLIGDVLILPGNSFGALQNGFPQNEGPTLVTHHYAGSWKNDHGGEVV
jgi:alpha 1,6-mannosyltransferase